jgi:DeoR family transcriptional regulator, suf operon transcriptional repressor
MILMAADAPKPLKRFEIRPMSTQTESSDKTLLDFLRREGAVTISELVAEMRVTATAVRQRLGRLMEDGLIERVTERKARGRPNHRYSLTDKGERAAGTNFADIAIVLWQEIKSVEDPNVRRGLLKRVADRMVTRYREEVTGDTLQDRMSSMARLMGDREIPFEVDTSGELPVLSALACPYPELAQIDRGICTMEKLMLSELLGDNVRLSECRLDGAQCCTFTPSGS